MSGMTSFARTLYAAAKQAYEAGDLAGAERALRFVAGTGWQTAEVLYFLGFLRLRQNDAAAALGLMFSAALASPNDARMLCHMGEALHRLGDYEIAESCLRAAIEQRPDHAEAHANLAATLRALGRLDESLEHFRRVQMLQPDDARAPYFLQARYYESLVLLTQGDYLAAWDKHEARLKFAWGGNQPRDFVQPQWSGAEDIAGKTILLHTEQGFGDTIQFVRYAPLVAARGARVLLELDRFTLALCSGVPGVAAIIARGETLPAFDLHCPLLSLPRAFRTELASIPADVPYLHPDATSAAAWRERLGEPRGRRVGIAWSGNPNHPNDRARSIPLAAFAPLLARRDLEFHVVQQHVRPADRDTLDAMPHVRDHSRGLTDFAETAALLSQMDLVISADTAVAHLAGALALPTWLLLPFSHDWRWLVGREDSPWYPTMRLFRQPVRGDWGAVIERAAALL